jgi:cholest-4-en-3-one 26-monooxygenase
MPAAAGRSATSGEACFVRDIAAPFPLCRDPNPHIGFGGGPHFCLGTHLVRLEPAVPFEALLDRMPGIERRGPPPALFINGIKELPVRFGAR